MPAFGIPTVYPFSTGSRIVTSSVVGGVLRRALAFAGLAAGAGGPPAGSRGVAGAAAGSLPIPLLTRVQPSASVSATSAAPAVAPRRPPIPPLPAWSFARRGGVFAMIKCSDE